MPLLLPLPPPLPPPPVIPHPRQNHLLAALALPEFDRLLPHLALVELRLGEVVCEAGAPVHNVYFPTTAILSSQYSFEDGGASEVAGIGNEGVLGLSLFMGGQTTISRTVVQTGGHGYRLPAGILMAEFQRTGAVFRLLLRHTQALIA